MDEVEDKIFMYLYPSILWALLHLNLHDGGVGELCYLQLLLMELLLQGMILNLIYHNKPPKSDMGGKLDDLLHEKNWLESRLKVLVEACEGNSSLLTEVKKLKAVAEQSSL